MTIPAKLADCLNHAGSLWQAILPRSEAAAAVRRLRQIAGWFLLGWLPDTGECRLLSHVPIPNGFEVGIRNGFAISEVMLTTQDAELIFPKAEYITTNRRRT